MVSMRHFITTLRRTTHCLVLISLLAGPFGGGASAAARAGDTPCPCLDADAGALTGEPCQDGGCNPDVAQSHCEHSGPCPCSDTCQDCECHPGIMLGALFVFTPRFLSAPRPVIASACNALPIMGVFSGTFRPPQSRI